MNYSYWCKHCGYTTFSNSKDEIRKARQVHEDVGWRRRSGMLAFRMNNACLMFPVDDTGTIARPDLIDILRKDGVV